jgi:transposase
MRFIIGCDFHPSYQQIAMLDTETGELVKKRLAHVGEEARTFYAGLPGPARVGIEASGQSQWFEKQLGELGHQVWIGDAAKIRAAEDRKQKTDGRDALLILDLQGAFRASGCPLRKSGTRGNCCCIGTSWCGCGRR